MRKLAVVVGAIFALSFSSIQAWANEAATSSGPDKATVAVSELVISPSISEKQATIVRNSSLIADVENAIRNGRKFDLLTRRGAALEAIRKEQKFAQSGLAAGDAAVEGQLSNADLILLIEVTQFSFGRSSSRVPNTEKYRVSDSCSIELSVQILDSSRGSVTASFPIKASAKSGTAMANKIGTANTAILSQTLEKAAASLANQLSDTVFPITVLSVKGKRLFVNRGNDSGLKPGDIFDVFEPGEELIDPETGENLGSTEMEVGKARVIRVNPKMTIMEVINGDPSYMQQGFILRAPVK